MWQQESNYGDPGIVMQNGDVLYMQANCYTPYLTKPGFNWQENLQIFYKKN